MFWDGNPGKQSFIRIVGLSTPDKRPRPASAPARGSHASGLFGSPRKKRPLSSTAGDSVGRRTEWDARQHVRGEHKGEHKASARDEAGDRLEMGRARVLEIRLRELVRENARMRDAFLEMAHETRLGQLAKAQKRSLGLQSCLQAAKESIDTVAIRAFDKRRSSENGVQDEAARPARTQQSLPPSRSRPNEGMASNYRPAPASRGRRQVIQKKPKTPGVPNTSTAVARDEANPSPSRSLSRKIVFGGRGEVGKDVAGSESSESSESSRGRRILSVGGNTGTRSSGRIADKGRPRREEHHAFVSARQGNIGSASETPSPQNLQDSMVDSSRIATFTGSDPLGTPPTTTTRRGPGAVDPTPAGKTDSGAEEAAAEGDQHGGKQTLGGGKHKANLAGGARGECSGIGGSRRSRRMTAPEVLLAREAQAAVRRAERVAAAKQKEEEENRLSSSFRAKEVHATSGPSWATIKAHQDMVRKQRIRDRAAFLAATSSLPARMARHAAMQDVAADRARSEEGRAEAVVKSGLANGCMEDGVGEDSGGVADTTREQPEDIVRVMHRRQKRWEASLAAAKASSRTAVTRPRTPPMEKRRMAQEARRRAREKEERSMREAAQKQRADTAKREFRQLIAVYRASGNTFRETKASVRKAEETRQKIEQDKQKEEQQRLLVLAEEARGREVSRAVREYVAASEARRREEHGAGPPLEELVQRKKEEKKAELQARRKLNRSGLREALRKRPNLLERQEKYAQQHSKRLAAQASTAREFLESREGFDAAGRRALGGKGTGGGVGRGVRGAGGRAGWMEKAATDKSFSSREKAQLGLAEVPLGADSAITTSGAPSDNRDNDKVAADGAIPVEDKTPANVPHGPVGDGAAINELEDRRNSDGPFLSTTVGAETSGLSPTGSETAASDASCARTSDKSGEGGPDKNRNVRFPGDLGDEKQVGADVLKPRSQPDENDVDVEGSTVRPLKEPPEHRGLCPRQEEEGRAEKASTMEVGDSDGKEPVVDGRAP